MRPGAAATTFPRASNVHARSSCRTKLVTRKKRREKGAVFTERVGGGRRALRAPLSAVAVRLTVGGIRQIEILPGEEAEG